MDHSLNNISNASERKTESLAQAPESAQATTMAPPSAANRARWRLALFSACVVMVVAGVGVQIAVTPKGGISPLAKQTSNTLSILKQALMDTMWPATPKALAAGDAATTSTTSTTDSNWEFANASVDPIGSTDATTTQDSVAEPQRASTSSEKSVAHTATSNASNKAVGVAAQACPDAGQVCVVSPRSGATVRGVVQVQGTATAPNFAYYKFEFEDDSRCLDPYDGRQICFLDSVYSPAVDATLMTFDTRRTSLGARIPNGTYWVRLVVVDQTGNELPQKARIQITIQN